MIERLKIGRLALLSGCAVVANVTPAYAQSVPTTASADAPSAESRGTSSASDIVVTGTRVVRDGYNQPTPVTVATTAELAKATPTNLADALNKLPQFANSVSPAANSQLQGNSGEHGNLLNLRGVGPTRALILLDGIRVPPTTFRGAVDVDTIPQLLIQRVDVVTGGASAVYGSDAVSGAVNFVLDKKFEGVKGVAQRGVSTRGDLGNYRVGIAGGLSFGGGRGHVLASVERYDSEGIKRSARIYGDDAYSAVGSVPGSASAPGRAGNPFIFLPNLRFTTNDYNNGLILTSTVPSLANSIFLPGGAVRPIQRGTPTGTPGTNVGGDGLYIPGFNQLIAPLTTTQGYGRLAYDLTETLTAHVQGSYSRSVTSYDTQAQSVLGFRFFSGNAFLNPTVQAQLGPNDSFTMFRFIAEQGPIPTRESTSAYLINGGLEWNFGGWNVTADYTRGNSVTKFAQRQVEIPKIAAALDAVRAPNGSIVCRVTLTNPGLYPGCVPINVFGAGTPGTADLETVLGVSRYRARNTTDDFVLSARGDLIELPAGPVTIAVGGQYRRQKLDLTSNSDPTVPVDFTGLRGVPANRMTRFNNTNVGAAFGKLNVKEVFAEAQVPIFKGQPFAEELSLNGAVRLTDYSTSGSVKTWKIGAVYKPINDIMFRVTRSHDIRAPSLFELFAGIQTAPVNFNDPHTGTPGSIRQFSGGNKTLKPETGDTFSAGVVLSPSFLPGFNVSIDYYDLKIKGAIATQGLNDVINECEASNGASPTCDLIQRPLPFSDRSAANYPISVSLITQNISFLRTSGFDVAMSYRTNLGNGDLTLRAYANYLDRYKTQTNSIVPVIDYAGHGANSQTVYGYPKFRGTLSANYTNGGLTLFVQESMIGKVTIGNLKNDPTSLYAVPAIDPVFYTDATVSYKFDVGGSPEFFLTATNLFDRKPPLVAAAGAPGLVYPTLFTLYNVAGRTFTAGIRFQF